MNHTQIKLMQERYEQVKDANLRTINKCPCCGTNVTKNYKRTVFCSLTCKDFYWNTVRSVVKEDYDSKMDQIKKFNQTKKVLVTGNKLTYGQEIARKLAEPCIGYDDEDYEASDDNFLNCGWDDHKESGF